MRAIFLTVVVLGCHHDELGSTPRLLGKLANISVHDTQDQVEAVDWHLAQDRVIDDGALSYGIHWDHHRIRSAIVWVKGSIDDVAASWGDGVIGSKRDAHQRFYFDVEQRTRYEVTATPDGYVIEAMPYRPIEDILGVDEEVKVFGIDMFALLPDAVTPALEDKLLSTSRFAGPTTIVRTENNIATDVGDVGLMVEARIDVSSYSLEVHTESFVDGRERVHALLARKWGPPHGEGAADLYRSAHASRIRVREHDDFIDIEVDR